MGTKVEINWLSEMAFEAEVDEHRIIIDADEAVGGKNRGPRPKPLTLASLGGCTGMDVISILRKMRVEPEKFTVSVEGQLTDEHPKYYHAIHIIYSFKGKDLPLDKIQKAVDLSQDRYCGVSELLRKGAELTHEIRITE